MQKRANGKQLMIIGVVVMVLIVGIGFMLTSRGGSSKASTTPNTVSVVMADQTIPNGQVFKDSSSLTQFFKVKKVPSNLKPFGAYTNLKQIAQLLNVAGCGPVKSQGCDGQVTTSETIYQNSPVVDGMFSTLGQYRTSVGPSFAIPYGYVGIAVNFDAANSVLGSVEPGDTIDLIASWKGGKAGNLKATGQTQYALNDMRVISVNAPPSVPGASTTTSSTTNTSTTSAADAGGSLVLLARYQQALEIQHLKDFGWQLSCVLRSAKETNILHFKTEPVTDKWFFVKTSDPFRAHPGY